MVCQDHVAGHEPVVGKLILAETVHLW
jgi:hypothetical protein